MWQELECALKEQGDPRIFGNGDIFDKYEYVGRAPHSWANYVKNNWQKQEY